MSIPLGRRDLDAKRPGPVADVASNDAPSASRAIAIVIDPFQLTTNAETLVRVRRAIVDVLRGLSDEDEVAVLFTGRSALSVDFTRDPARLLGAVEQVKAALEVGGRRGVSVNDVRSALWTVRNACTLLTGSGIRAACCCT